MKCEHCDKELNSSRKKYCNNKCQADLKYKKYIESWLNGKEKGIRARNFISKHIRRYLLEINNNSCQNCGWIKINQHTKIVPLEVHHMDGNSFNNKIENLELLCPNCHSLTENYKSLNKNSKRKR